MPKNKFTDLVLMAFADGEGLQAYAQSAKYRVNKI